LGSGVEEVTGRCHSERGGGSLFITVFCYNKRFFAALRMTAEGSVTSSTPLPKIDFFIYLFLILIESITTNSVAGGRPSAAMTGYAFLSFFSVVKFYQSLCICNISVHILFSDSSITTLAGISLTFSAFLRHRGDCRIPQLIQQEFINRLLSKVNFYPIKSRMKSQFCKRSNIAFLHLCGQHAGNAEKIIKLRAQDRMTHSETDCFFD